MNVAFEHVNRTLIAKIEGDIDHHSCDMIRNQIDNEIMNRNPKNMIFDMDQVGFMDSSGIGVLLGRYKKIFGQGGKTAMIKVKPQIKRICEICGLQKIIPIYRDKRQAIENIKEC